MSTGALLLLAVLASAACIRTSDAAGYPDGRESGPDAQQLHLAPGEWVRCACQRCHLWNL